jgi:xylulokinase
VAEAERLGADFAYVTGSLPMAGLTAPKLLWLQEHEPEVFKAIDCVLSPKDYLRLCLTGERISEMSDAAGTLWLDVARREWFTPMLRATGLAPWQMPRLVEGGAPSARLTATQLGLSPEVVIAGGGGDNPVAAVGIGAVHAGDGFITLGTSAAIVAITDHAAGNPASAVHSFCHALPDRWYTMGAMLAGASCLRWSRRNYRSNRPCRCTRRCSCRTWPANARRTTTPCCAAALWGWGMTAHRRCSAMR